MTMKSPPFAYTKKPNEGVLYLNKSYLDMWNLFDGLVVREKFLLSFMFCLFQWQA